jgi:K+-sensing histidine kinase KdpD
MIPVPRQAVSTLTAVVLLAAAAGLACFALATSSTRTLVPAAFVVVVVLVALRFGAPAGILGSLVGAAIFARWLYPPLGSLRIEDAAARDHLGWMLLAGISLSYLLAAPDVTGKRQHK